VNWDIKFKIASYEQRKFCLIGKSLRMEITVFGFRGFSLLLVQIGQKKPLSSTVFIKNLFQVTLLYPLFFCSTAASGYPPLPCHYQLFPIFFLLVHKHYPQHRFINALSPFHPIFRTSPIFLLHL